MKTLKSRPSIHLLLITLLIATSCVPDSLTKFKEDEATASDDNISIPGSGDSSEEVDTGFIDESGSFIDPNDIIPPTSIGYDTDKKFVFITGDASLINIDYNDIVTYVLPSGNFNDYKFVYEEESEEYALTAATKNNFIDLVASNPGFNFGTDITTTYSSTFVTDNLTGLIITTGSSIAPMREHTLDPITFDFYNPTTSAEDTIIVTSTPTLSVQAPIPERLSFETDLAFNCTGTGFGTTVPSTPTIGDAYLNAGTCYYNYDGTNTNTVAFPYSGPVYISFNLTTNDGFLLNDITTESFTTDQGAQGTITHKDTNGNVYGTLTSGQIFPGDKIDNALPFQNAEATINKLRYFFQPESNINLKLINDTSVSPESHISYDNSTSITISPDLPSSLRLVKDVDSPLFGYIIDTSGINDHTYQEAVEYTVTISNDITERSFKFDLGIINPPEKLSYSQLVAFKVKNLIQSTSNFTVGQEIATTVTPPFTEGGKGIVKRILDIDGNSKYLIVQVISGDFAFSASVDNYDTFLDEEAVIQTEPISLTHLIQINSTAAFTDAYVAERPALCMRFTASPSDEFARAIVTGNPTETGLTNYLFINQVRDTESVESKRNFVASNGALTDCTLGTSYTLNEIWSPVMLATFSNVSSLVSGMDILTNTGRANLVVSHVDSGTNTAILQSSDGKSITMALPGETFSSVRPYSASAATISDFESLITFELHRGVESIIKSTLPTGEDVTYSVSPELPTGLTLDPNTGDITGTPEIAAASKSFTVEAKNILGSVKTTFDILIEDYFEVEVSVEGTPRFYNHKDGEGNFFNRCRIKKRDIVGNTKATTNDVEDVVDIDCYVDIGENNLYYKQLNINANVGPGICHSVEYRPFSFFKKRPLTTDTNVINYSFGSAYVIHEVENASEACLTSSTTSFSDGIGGSPAYDEDGYYINGVKFEGKLDELCAGNYPGGIDCDNGRFTYGHILYDYTPEVLDDDGITVLTPSECTSELVEIKEHNCGGNPLACLNGPIRDEFTKAEVEDGFTRRIHSSFHGLNITKSPTTPRALNSNSNRYVSTYMDTMSCSDGNTEYFSDGIKRHSIKTTAEDPHEIIDPFLAAQPYYTFSCLDEFTDLQARINIHIRDWDNSFDLANIDKTDSASMDAGTSQDVFGNYINNTLDWDDYNFSTNYSGCTDSSAPSVGVTHTTLGSVTAFKGDTEIEVIGSDSDLARIYPGMNILIGGDFYIIAQKISKSEFTLYAPIRTDYAGATFQGQELLPFPANDWPD